VTVVDARTNLWEVLAGRAPGKPTGPADPGLWQAVSDRLNPARATPRLRDDIEVVQLISARGATYLMLRSPDHRDPCYVRLTPEEWALADLMDGERSVARLVAEFARITGRLAPEQVTRVVADLAANRMLDELPVDAFRPLSQVRREPLAGRIAATALAFLRGRRVVLARVDPFVGLLYKAGGRLLFTRPVALVAALIAAAGLFAFCVLWFRGAQSVFLTGDSYLAGAVVLFLLNIVALACHELGHALAVKHAGRHVPGAGFLLYFGIPSFFVDTTDVWMSGRRHRILTTAAGPATALVLAGMASLSAFIVPPVAPLAFKLAFAWYLHALFNLNPFLALDGYYLLMDWLEVPNLRARAMAWVGARLRLRPPRFGDLDREGRLIALYGMLALGWLLIAADLAWRLYVDRVSGLVTGLWHDGWAGRALLAAVVVGLMTPVVYALSGRIVRAWVGWRRRTAESHVFRDLPNRLAALRRSALNGLPEQALGQLAHDARWVRPRSGAAVVDRGSTMGRVLVVVDGVVEARRPGDPGGVIRQRVGPGGVIGLANAFTGSPASLAWHAIGATMLTIPAPTLVAAIGELPAPPPADLAELEDLLDEAPQLAALSAEAYLGATSRAEAIHLRPGAPVVLDGPADTAVVAAGVLTRYDGEEVRRGTMLGPFGNEEPGEAAEARTQARVWRLPGMAMVSPLPMPGGPAAGTPAPLTGAGTVHHPPMAGAHPPAGYPPLAVPPGPPTPDIDPEVDGRFERRLWWLLIVVLLTGLLLGVANFWPGPAWAEMPSDRALASVSSGSATFHLDGAAARVSGGDERYLGAGDRIEVGGGSAVRLVFRGGAVAVLCAGTAVTLGDLASPAGHPVSPSATLALTDGRLLADTASTSVSFRPLALTVRTGAGPVTTTGPARLTAEPGAVQVTNGTVALGGTRLAPTGTPPVCGDGTALPTKAGGDASSSPPLITTEPSPTPSASASESPSPSPSASRSASRSPSRSPTGAPTTTTTTPPPPPLVPPVIDESSKSADPDAVCGSNTTTITLRAADADDQPSALSGSYTVSGGLGSGNMTRNGTTFSATLAAFTPPPTEPQTITINVTIRDDDNQSDSTTLTVAYEPQCPPE
jgi:putative peptide zinc metalloprotease protein